jgi:serine/threonine-protein kinase
MAKLFAHVNAAPPAPSEAAAALAAFDAVVACAMAKDPDERFRTAAELATAATKAADAVEAV